MEENEPKLKIQILRAVIAVAVVLAVLLALRFSGLLQTEYDVPATAVESAKSGHKVKKCRLRGKSNRF